MTRRSVRWIPFLLLPLLLGAAQAGEGGHAAEGIHAEQFFLVFIAILVASKIFGELAERIGQPAVLGELLAGVLLGASVLGIIPADGAMADMITILAEIGVAILLFEIGLETDLKEMARVGGSATTVACVGVAMPFLLGFAYWMWASPGLEAAGGNVTHAMVAIFVGATLTATSVGITARVLTDLDRIHTPEARIIIGAAVIDDVLGLVILAVVSGLAAGAALSLVGIATTFAVAVGFLVAAVIIGNIIAPYIFDFVDRMRVRGVLLVSALSFALLIAALAGLANSAMIIGSFAAGLVLSGTNQFDLIEERIKPVADIFTPIFFVNVGSFVDVSLFIPGSENFNWAVLGVGAALIAVAIVGKLVSGYAVGWRGASLSHAAIGVGMIPRGEVGLIFADLGLREGILTPETFSAVLIMVMVTTFMAPPLLKVIFRREPEPAAGEAAVEPASAHAPAAPT